MQPCRSGEEWGVSCQRIVGGDLQGEPTKQVDKALGAKAPAYTIRLTDYHITG